MSSYGITFGSMSTASELYPNYLSTSSSAKPESTTAADTTGRTSSPGECQTCKNRKYMDGSNENVSYKSAAHIAPSASGAAVRAHEGEHVANAYDKAAANNGKVISASVSIHTAVCPECGRTYVSGGTTSTTIRYSDESNPYQKQQKALDALRFTGNNIDYVA